MTGTCPVTGGLPTRMSRSSFATVCEAKRIAANEAAEKNSSGWQWSRCLECGGNDIPPELSFMEDIMAAKKYIQGTCEVCEKMANITKSNGKFVCSTCEHIVRAVRNRPDIVRRLMWETYGDGSDVAEIKTANIAMERILDGIKEALKVPDNTSCDDLPDLVEDMMRERAEYAAELYEVIKALECDAGDSPVDMAERRVTALRELEQSYSEAVEREVGLESEIMAGNEARTNLQREVDSLRAQLKQYDLDRSGNIQLNVLLANKNILAAINALADALEEV